MFSLLLIFAIVVLVAFPSVRRSLASLLDPDDRRSSHSTSDLDLNP